MSASRLYKITPYLRQCCSILNLSPARVLERCGLTADFLENEDKGVDATTYFSAWSAYAEESKDPELPLTLGRAASRGPLQPALLAFAASPDIHTGFNRLAIFKPLVAPIRLHLTEDEDAFTVGFESECGQPVPNVMSATEVIFFLDFARTFTAHHIVPKTVQLPHLGHVTPDYQTYVGAPIVQSQIPAITFSMQDARRSLISADTDFYRLIERDLLSKLESVADGIGLAKRVARTLTDLLPSGAVSADQVSARLGISKRTLQRKLKVEGSSFQNILDETRATLAMTYLRDQKLSAEETSYLLAYQDPNSFYRAFHEWTGMTPSQAREMQLS
ncbi:AraC family transcriptional regulator [Puniceibacterium sp. IMCC21224]|uniref:AraC family transcriptional regulator n=1 Tax=Puniceibacterium sp. IMCC21224 TaxID=1618204 RepID=UPI00064D94EB|nr:AraC family transcriptional regulator [Puniceibacterium sp. IMCC21224]KMK66428.1 DNA-binding domain-containing protein, AraC-type [Puniceibacterium sp. IMCC21224]